MRYFGGLVGLLLVVALIAWLWAKNTETIIETSKPAQDMTQQFAGRDANGVKAQDSIQVGPNPAEQGKFRSLIVESIMAGGPMEKYYGLKQGDLIVQAGSLSFVDTADASMAKDLVMTAFQKMEPLIVMRNGEKLSLPLPPAPPAAAPPAQSAEDAAAAHKRFEDSKSSLDKQLQGIPGVH